MEMVRRAQEMGYIIGSASDKPIPLQKIIWERHGITVEFAIHKQNLDKVKLEFPAESYQHIGDTNIDEHYAVMHGFEFLHVDTALDEPWMLLNGGAIETPPTRLISFDIDGTLESGDPPGRVTMDMVRRAREMGYIIGSASDKPIPLQKIIWQRYGIEVEFAIHKQNLDKIKLEFPAESYQHIGDTNIDEHYAVMHGFEFLHVDTALDEPWMLLNGEMPAQAAPTPPPPAAPELDPHREYRDEWNEERENRR